MVVLTGRPEFLGSLGLTDEQKELAETLVELGQEHLLANWETDDDPTQRNKFFESVAKMNNSYPGGLKAYVTSAKDLLASSARGDNPLEGWVPSVPSGESLTFGSEEWLASEALGKPEAKHCGFVLVAGGLGERLGYSRIKVELPTETLTKTAYLHYYVKTILAVQKATGAKKPLPLAIMVSGDTEAMTRQMLKDNKDFGAAAGQISVVKQELVPALSDNDARIAADGSYAVQAKPHGHGDVHVLLHSSGLIKKWAAAGTEWVYFFQDTNALGFRPLYATLGVSRKLDLHCNFLTVPRLPAQAVGGIAKLVNEKQGKSMVVNVEYNQLDPLLKTTVNPAGDVAGPDGVHSPYPGNINQFVLKCTKYLETLERTKGVMGEFVNPKYADKEKTKFKKPTRLECMMQDYPKVLPPEENVGFIQTQPWIAFSACKNATAEAASQKPPACALSAEADQYFHCAEMLRLIGCKVDKLDAPETWCGISSDIISPAIVLDPSLGLGFADIKARVPAPDKVKVSASSSLALSGDITISSLDLDGGLVVKACPGAKVTLEGCVCHNKGFKRVAAPEDAPESIKIRGYDTVNEDGVFIDITSPGEWTITTDPATKKLTSTCTKRGDGCAIA